MSKRFPEPKIFTNALLNSHDITSLIRDAELHERALFTFKLSGQKTFGPTSRIAQENNAYGLDGRLSGPGTRLYASSPRNTTVRTLLGGEVLEQIRKGDARGTQERTDLDVELLLQGAEELCEV